MLTKLTQELMNYTIRYFTNFSRMLTKILGVTRDSFDRNDPNVSGRSRNLRRNNIVNNSYGLKIIENLCTFTKLL